MARAASGDGGSFNQTMKTISLVFLLSLCAFGQPTAGGSFAEPFTTATQTAQWVVTSVDGNSLRWSNGGPVQGFQFTPSAAGLAYAPWAVGNANFYLHGELNFSNLIGWRQNSLGISIGLTTAIPGSMRPSDVSIVASVLLPDILVSLRSGELTNLSGATLASSTMAWPQVSLSAASIPSQWNWWFSISRTLNLVTWSIYTDHYLSGSVPFYLNSFTIPSAQQAANFQFVAVSIVNGGTSSYGPAGVLSDLWGYASVSGGPVQTITGIVPGGGSTTFQTGNTATVTGTNFDNTSPYTVIVGSGGSYATATATYVNPTTLTVSLPAEPNSTAPYRLKVKRNGITAELLAGIVYSAPVVTRIDPHEVPPTPANSADGTVQIYGQGFTIATTVTVNGTPAAVTLISPLQLSVVVPNGPPGPAPVLVQNGGVTIYDSTNSATYPPQGQINFGYSPHPYMSVGANLASYRANWINPALAEYVAPLNSQILTPPNASSADAACQPLTCWNASAFPVSPVNVQTVYDYGWHYLFAQDGASGAQFFSLLPAELSRIDFSSGGFSANLENAGLMAELYDAYFPILTPAQRTRFLNYLDAALSYYGYVRRTFDSNTVPAGPTFNNRISIANSNGGMVALSLLESISHIEGYTTSSPWIATSAATEYGAAVMPLVTSANSYGNNEWQRDGGCVEGAQYCTYGSVPYIRFGRDLMLVNAMLGVSPADPGFFSANIQSAGNYAMNLWDGYTWQTYDDTQPQYYLVPLLTEFGNRYGRSDLLGLADYIQSRIVGENNGNLFTGHLNFQMERSDWAPFAFMWRGTAAPSVPAPALLTVLPSTQQATLRGAATFQPDFVAGLKGSSSSEAGSNQHFHNDQGSFVLQSHGEEFLIDPGYFYGTAVNHSLLSVDGVSPGTGTASIDTTTEVTDTNFRAVAVDATAAFASGVTHVRRTLVMYVDGLNRFLAVLDDIVPTGAGVISEQIRSGVLTTQTSSTLMTLTGINSEVSITWDGPAFSLSTAPSSLGCGISSTPSWVFCELNTNYNLSQISYVASPSAPMLTLISPTGFARSLVTTAKVDRSVSGVVRVTLSDGAGMTFTSNSGVWALTGTQGPRPPVRKIPPR